MNKKTYQKPKMQVYLLNDPKPLLAGTSGGGGGVIYIPRINEDLNKLA
jgi:hypothetical protein